MLYLALIPGDFIGWGVCSKNLILELRKLVPVEVLDPALSQNTTPVSIPGPVFHTIGDHALSKVFNIEGTRNFGYTFFENLVLPESKKNAEAYDLVFAGSTWCKERLLEHGIHWCEVLIQGIDPALFSPAPEKKPGEKDHFVIFSGGKFELRKGQDIVIRAVGVLQKRHPDVILVTSWHNPWAFSMNSMSKSPLINFEPQKRWDENYIKKLLAENGIDLARTEILPPIPQDQMRKLYACTDVGLFPNRCEGGTNLVLMEYMACGKPVIASYTSGHMDILTGENSFRLKNLSPFEMRNGDNERVALWEEPDLEEVIETLEYAYQNRSELAPIGRTAAEDMKRKTWRHSALTLVHKLAISLNTCSGPT